MEVEKPKSLHIKLPVFIHDILKVECALDHITQNRLLVQIITLGLKQMRDKRLAREEKENKRGRDYDRQNKR